MKNIPSEHLKISSVLAYLSYRLHWVAYLYTRSECFKNKALTLV